MNIFGTHEQNFDESGSAMLEVIGDFHDGFRHRLVMIQILGQLLAKSMERLDALLDTVGWEDTQQISM
jgi:hypothetical protein